MLRRISKKIKRRVAKTLAAGILSCPITAFASETVPIYWDGEQIFEVQYYGTEDKNDITTKAFNSDGSLSADKILTYNLSPAIKNGLNNAFLWWAEILAPGSVINQPAQYFVGTYTNQNADAGSFSELNGVETHNPDLFSEIFQNGRVVDYFQSVSDYQIKSDANNIAEKGVGMIRIGTYIGIDEQDGNFGWVNSSYYALPIAQAMKGIYITPVMFHEIGHSLGISADRRDNPYKLKFNDNDILIVGDGANNPLSFTSHLRNQYGQAPKANQLIMTHEMFNNADVQNQYLAATGKNLTAEDVFLVENVSEHKRLGKTYLYFVGDNVSEALGGKTFTRGDGTQVSGIPINMWEGYPDFSHSELARSMMSHQNYRSYNTFMEAELALLQDIGYEIDRKNFYGRSIYLDNQNIVNEQGFSARKDGEYVDGYNNSTLGVGLHVYGSNNNVTQLGNIWTNGYGAAGIRVDGLNDTITVPQGTEIHSDGIGGTGILVAYGKNHNIVVDGTVTANGKDGDAVHFEFGANTMGSTTEYRGSYIRYIRNVNGSDGKVTSTENEDIIGIPLFPSNDDYSITDFVNGDINGKMGSLTVNGKLESKSGNAIYIAEESFVDNVNINKNAQILGNIESTWKQFDKDAYGIYDTEQTVTYQVEEKDSDGNVNYVTRTGKIEPLYIQYNGKNYVYNRYIPDLVTNLNFNAADGSIVYNGNITGFDNMKINVNSGILYYDGIANVVNVNVAPNAQLFGGIYTVNDMNSRMAEGFSDITTGTFINHGKIGGVIINGQLFSDGTLIGDANNKIIVNGTANVEGSTASATNILPNESIDILSASNVTGNLANSTNPAPISGMLSATGSISGNKVITSARSANNLGNLNRTQYDAYDAVENMNYNLQNDSRREQLRPIYNFDAENAKIALESLGKSPVPQMMSHAQQNTRVSRLIGDRFSSRDISNDVWVKFTKNWGKLYGGEKFHGQAISGGWDKSFNDNWRGGIFISYDASTLERGNIYDTRGGIYANWHDGANEALIYLDGGQIRNKYHRGLNNLGLSTKAKYHGTIFELGAEYKRDLTPDKSYHLSPYINLQASTLHQNSFSESGAGIYNQHVRSKRNNFFAGQIGLEYKKNFERGNISARIGVRHAFSGAEPELNFRYEGGTNQYRLRNRQDKTHFILSLSGENEFAKDWTFGGEIFLQKGSHDRDLSATLFLRKIW